MHDILTITGPIYLLIAIGYLTTRASLFAKADMRVLGKFVLNLALPALIFNAMAQRPLGDILNLGYLLAYLVGTLTVMALGLLWCRRSAVAKGPAGVIAVMGMSCSNSSFVGYPIVLLALPAAAGIAFALTLLVENVIVIPLLLALAERGTTHAESWASQVRQSLVRLARNPLIMGLSAGLLVSLFRLELPVPLAKTISMLAMASGALSLFVIGGALVGLQFRGMVQQVAPVAFGKLLIHPLAVFLAFAALPALGLPPVEPALRVAAILLAAMPMMGIYPILAQAYEKEGFASAALLLTTLLSFVTLNLLLWLVAPGN